MHIPSLFRCASQNAHRCRHHKIRMIVDRCEQNETKEHKRFEGTQRRPSNDRKGAGSLFPLPRKVLPRKGRGTCEELGLQSWKPSAGRHVLRTAIPPRCRPYCLRAPRRAAASINAGASIPS